VHEGREGGGVRRAFEGGRGGAIVHIGEGLGGFVSCSRSISKQTPLIFINSR